MTKEVLNSIPSMPTPIRDQFTLYRQKLDTLKHLSTVEHPIEVSPVSFTLYIDGNKMITPIKLSDLFICKNSKYSFSELELDVEIRWGPRNREETYNAHLKMNDYIFNSDDKPHFCESQRYLVKARPLLIKKDEECSQNENRSRWRNILVVTGYHPLSARQQFAEAFAYMDNLRKQLTGKYRIGFLTSDQSKEYVH
ncbi:unnamed protein product [Mytilus edulis]|uniref:Uncharacterized protein n=1 Tax=Mytilus edulis TaxID=6550 RepID=A0A8S3Q903_MYTED|nr:unnamed protein product [Mytilus edulis]